MAIDRFNKEAPAALDDPRWAGMSLREYIRARGYGDDMFEFYLMPMGSAVWSTPPDKMEAFPAVTLLRFWHNHGFLGLDTQHQWWTVCGGARSYVAKMVPPFRDRIQLGRKATRVERNGAGVKIHDSSGGAGEFDKVILACHGDQAFALLADPTEDEARLLPAFRYQPNVATLHSDESFMPKTRRCWASWNYRIDSDGSGGLLATTHYWMNRLQGVSDRVNYFVSLNCHERIAPEKVHRRIDYEHPLFDLPAIRAQRELPALNASSQTTFYAGAWHRYGFHEDGFTSALDCARAVTREPIWTA
jgi:predicted NAD/FAD-binding protein